MAVWLLAGGLSKKIWLPVEGSQADGLMREKLRSGTLAHVRFSRVSGFFQRENASLLLEHNYNRQLSRPPYEPVQRLAGSAFFAPTDRL